MFALLLCAACAACERGGTEEMPPAGTPTALTESETAATAPETDGEEAPVKFTLDKETLTVFLQISEKETEAAVLLLPDREALKSWRDDPSVVIDIDQVKTDEKGRAEVRLTLPENCPSAILWASAGESVYEREVR